MGRGVRTWLVLGVVVVAGYPAAAWVIGRNAESQWQSREQQLLQQIPSVVLVKRDYRRGVYTSTEEVTYRLHSRLTQALRVVAITAGTDVGDFQFTVRNTLHHGPLPQLRAFAPLTVDTQIILPAKVQEGLANLLGGQGGLTIHTRMKWLGGSTTNIHSPAFEHHSADGTTLTSRGIDSTAALSGDLEHLTSSFNAPGFGIKVNEKSFDLENFRLDSDQHNVFGTFYAGTMSFTVGRIAIEQKTPQFKASLQGLSLDSQTSVQSEYLDVSVKIAADALQSESFSATRLGYDFRASHLHGPSLASLTRAYRTLEAGNSDSTQYQQKVQQILKTDGVEILLHNPVVEFPHIGFTTPQGAAAISLKASAPGLTRADLEGDPDAIRAALVTHVQAAADLRIDTDLLDKFLDSAGKGNSDVVAAQLRALEDQGYLKLDGKALTTHLVYEGGKLTVNGKPFPAVGPPAPQPPSPRRHP